MAGSVGEKATKSEGSIEEPAHLNVFGFEVDFLCKLGESVLGFQNKVVGIVLVIDAAHYIQDSAEHMAGTGLKRKIAVSMLTNTSYSTKYSLSRRLSEELGMLASF